MRDPVFDHFPPLAGLHQPSGVAMDYLGSRYKAEWTGFDAAKIPGGPFFAGSVPVDDEYFEWISTLESVRDAGASYVMLELGAGYGRWGIRAALAARQRGIRDIKIIFAEAEPQHAAWLRDAVAFNAIEHCSRVYEAALAYDDEPVPFVVQYDGYTAEEWYGQSVFPDAGAVEQPERYFGRPVYKTPNGCGLIYVTPMSLERMTADVDRIDLLNADLQTGEREMVRRSMETLNRKVRRAFISTHAADIDELCLETFAAHGWRNVRSFKCMSESETPYGRLKFNDGVQDWINPRLTIGGD